MKRIAHFIDTEIIGGAEIVLLDLAQGIRERGYEPVIFHFRHPLLPELAAAANIPSFQLPGYELYKSSRTLHRFARGLAEVLEQERIDLVHTHLFGPAVGAALSRYYRPIPHVATLHDIYIIEERRARARLLQLAAWTGSNLVMISENMRWYYSKLVYLPNHRRHLIQNGIDISCYHSTSSVLREELRATLGIKQQEVVFTCVARLTELKRHDLILRALARLKSTGNHKLLFVGVGPEEDSLRKLAYYYEVQDRVLFLGMRHDIPEILHASDVFVLASDTEGLSRSVLEAMAAGLPSVVTDVGGNSELVLDEVTGLIVPPNDAESLSGAMLRLSTEEALRKKFAEAAFERAVSSFSRSRMLDRYTSLYEKLLAAKSGATKALSK